MKKYPTSRVVVFVVWEPILTTDWTRPGTGALSRASDGRVRQYWDPNHLVAIEMKKAEANSKLHPDCCERNGVLWDLTTAYPSGAEWKETMPAPILMQGPVVDTTAALEALLEKPKR